MNNRSSFRDFLLIGLMLMVLLLLVLAMFQYDRQWDRLRTMDDKLNEQAAELRQLRELMRSTPLTQATPAPPVAASPTPAPAAGSPNTGAPAASAAPVPGAETGGPFSRIRSARQMPGYAPGDWVVDAFGGGVAKLTPLLSGDTYASMVQGNVLESLATRDPETLAWAGLIASSWQIQDNIKVWQAYVDRRMAQPLTLAEILAELLYPKETDKQEGYIQERMKQGRLLADIVQEPDCPAALAIRFQLRQNVTFSDGVPLTADDVVFTFNFIMDPKINSPREKAYYRKIRSVTKLGDYEVEFRFNEPYFEAFDLAGGMAIMPRHFYGAMTAEDFNQSVGYLLGSGPYRLESSRDWKPGALIQLFRNERYWGVAPAFDRQVFREVNNDVARLTAFRNGEIDLFAAGPEQYRELLRDKNITARSHSYEYQSPMGGYRYIAWNQLQEGKPTPFADRRVRQAMTLLLDRQRMINDLMLGYALLATGPFSPLSRQCDPALQPWPHDVAKALALLKEAGYADRNGDGVIETPDGAPFRFKLTYPSGNPNYEKMALFIKDSLAAAGVIMEPDPLEWAVFTERLGHKNFQAITLGWSAGIETDIYQMFHSSQMIEGGDNFMSYRNPQLDKLIEQARICLDEDKRMELWRQCHRIMHEDQPYTFLSFGKSLRFIDNRIQNIQILRLGMNPREEWFVPKAGQRWTR